MTRVSIKDIAGRAGVSHSTVSRALGNSGVVSPVTRERIRDLAREMGYSPDAQARSLVRGRTETLGVVVTTIADPFVAEVVQGIESTAHEAGYTVILTSSAHEPQRELEAVDILRSKRVDGVIVTSSRVGAIYLDHLERIGVPLVLINNHHEESGPYTHCIGVDNPQGGWLATQHLTESGHRRIAYVTGPGNHSSNAGRFEGYCRALQEADVPVDPDLVVAGDGRCEGGQRALARLVERSPAPSAVFCYNDMTAIGVLSAARQMGVRVPDDLAVVGFDNIPFAAYVHPRLTTVAQPKFEMGQRAVQMVLGLVQGMERPERVSHVVVQGELVLRESSRSDRSRDYKPNGSQK